MITQWFLDLPYYALASFISILPASQGFPSEVLTGANLIGAQLGLFSPVFPTADLAAALGILFSAQIAVWSWKTLKWIISHVPLIGGRG